MDYSTNDRRRFQQGASSVLGIIVVVIIAAALVYFFVLRDAAPDLSAQEVFDRSDAAMDEEFKNPDGFSASVAANMFMDGTFIEQGAQVTFDLDVDFEGAVELQQDGGLTGTLATDIKALRYDLPGLIDLDFGQPSGEVRLLDDTVYLNFSNLDSIGILDFSSLNGMWIAVDAPGFQDGVKSAYEQFLKESDDAPSTFSLFDSVEELPMQSVRGQKSYHYQVTFSPEGFDQLQAFIEGQGGALLGQDQTDVENIDWSQIKTEIWVGSKDFLIRKMTMDMPLAALGIQDVLSETSEATVTGSYAFTLEAFDYGKSVDVDVPPDARPWEEVQQELVPSL